MPRKTNLSIKEYTLKNGEKDTISKYLSDKTATVRELLPPDEVLKHTLRLIKFIIN